MLIEKGLQEKIFYIPISAKKQMLHSKECTIVHWFYVHQLKNTLSYPKNSSDVGILFLNEAYTTKYWTHSYTPNNIH